MKGKYIQTNVVAHNFVILQRSFRLVIDFQNRQHQKNIISYPANMYANESDQHRYDKYLIIFSVLQAAGGIITFAVQVLVKSSFLLKSASILATKFFCYFSFKQNLTNN